MKKRLWKLHSWMGLFAGLALLVIGLTGSLLVFATELESWFNPGFMFVEDVKPDRLPMDQLLAEANRALPNYEITGWLVRHDEPHLADVLYMIGHGTNEWQVGSIDPYTGIIKATPRDFDATLTGWLLALHYQFFADHTGMIITAILGVVLCALGITGLYIYGNFWKNFFRLRWRASARIFLSDFHRAVGISSVALNLLLGFTGSYWNFTHVIGEWMEGEHEQPVITGRMYGDSVSLGALMEESSRRIPGFRPNYITLPYEPGVDFTLWGQVETSNPFRGDYGSTVSFDPQTGAFKAATDIRQAGWWTQFVDMFEPLHFGSFGGLPIKIIWCLAGLTPGILAITGTLLWWKRTRTRASKNNSASPPNPKPTSQHELHQPTPTT